MKALKAALMFAAVLGVITAGAVSLWLGRGVKLAVERAEGKRRLDAGLRAFVGSQK